MDNSLAWFAIYVKARHEKVVLRLLEQRQVECYLPLKNERKQWKDRKKEVSTPLISGYLFVRIDIRNYYNILVVPGVLRFVTFENQPCRIPDYQIEDLKIFLQQQQHLVEVSNENVRKGQLVRICEGPLANAIGQVNKIRGKKRIVVQIAALGCIVHVELGLEQFELLSKEELKTLNEATASQTSSAAKNNMPLTSRTSGVKKTVFCALLFLSLLFPGLTPKAFAGSPGDSETTGSVEAPPYVHTTRKDGLWSSNQSGDVFFSGGLGRHFDYTNIIGGNGAIDYLFSDKFSVGAHAGLYYHDAEFHKKRTPFLGPRLGYHFVRPGQRVGYKPWDIYVAASGDVYFGGGVVKAAGHISFKADLQGGALYRISRSMFLWGELSVRTVTVGLSYQL